MSRSSVLQLLLLIACACVIPRGHAQNAKPNSPLTCHGVVCALPTSSCQQLESNACLKGGGPPRCPAIVNVADGTSCNDGNVCTGGDVCTSGVCGGSPVTCSSPTDMCTPSTGCATPCPTSGCTVAAANGYGSPSLTIPDGALSESVAITMVDQGGDPNDASVFHVYQFGPAGTIFLTPATVDLPAPPLTAGQVAVIEVSDDGTNWTAIPTTVNGDRVSGPIAHFSFCRTRARVDVGTVGMLMLDVVQYQDARSALNPGGLQIPPSGEAGSCTPVDLFGICIKIQNSTANTITSTCATSADPLSDPACVKFHVIPWWCSDTHPATNYPAGVSPTDPTYEGDHCSSVLTIGGDSIYGLDSVLPGGTLLPGQIVWVDLSFYGGTPPVPLNNVFPYSSLGSGFYGFDVLFGEPSGGCGLQPKAGTCDWQTGIRSAKNGPFVEVPAGTGIYVPPGEPGCTSTTTCVFVCSPVAPATTCKAPYDYLVNHAPNYPTLRCQRAGALIDCNTAITGDQIFKNWLMDAAF